jgi:hypothetical protein
MKVYSGIEGIEKPTGYGDDYQQKTEEYVEKIKAEARKRSKGAYVGKEVRFQVADGYAVYVIASEKPMSLIHLDIYDGYQEQYVHRLTARDIKEEVDRRERFEAIWTANKG